MEKHTTYHSCKKRVLSFKNMGDYTFLLMSIRDGLNTTLFGSPPEHPKRARICDQNTKY